jgi:hypothetical protein
MTREQAHNELQNKVKRSPHNNNYYHGGDLQGLVDQIFDDSESRTCAKCKHFKNAQYNITRMIDNGDCALLEINTSMYFGCNKWEQQ